MTNQENPTPNDLPALCAELARQLANAHAHQQATKALVLATIAALGKASPQGLRLIENHALKAAEMLVPTLPDAQAQIVRTDVEAILAAARAAVTGKAPPRGR